MQSLVRRIIGTGPMGSSMRLAKLSTIPVNNSRVCVNEAILLRGCPGLCFRAKSILWVLYSRDMQAPDTKTRTGGGLGARDRLQGLWFGRSPCIRNEGRRNTQLRRILGRSALSPEKTELLRQPEDGIRGQHLSPKSKDRPLGPGEFSPQPSKWST